jgi:hypothetical protein
MISASHVCLDLPNCILPSSFLTNILYAILSFPMRATRLTKHILLDVIILIKFREEYKLKLIMVCNANGCNGVQAVGLCTANVGRA